MASDQVEAALVLLEEFLDRLKAISGAHFDRGTLSLINLVPLVIESLRDDGVPIFQMSDVPRYHLVSYSSGGIYMILTKDIGLHLAKEQVDRVPAGGYTRALGPPAPPIAPVMVLQVSEAAAAIWPDPIFGDDGYHRGHLSLRNPNQP